MATEKKTQQDIKTCPQGANFGEFLKGIIKEGWTIKSSDASSGVVVVEKVLNESKKPKLLD